MSAAARKKPRSRRKQKKTELVYGLGATGLSVARYFAERDIEVRFVDSRENPPGCDELASLLPEADVIVGETPPELLDTASRVARAKPILQSSDDPSLALQRLRHWQVQLEGVDADRQGMRLGG